jgi:von Willebrand factor A domain-containing protein 8
MDAFGNSGWCAGPLVTAALDGNLLVLDGFDRISGDTLASLSRLCFDRELDLPDGTRLLRHDLFDALRLSSSAFELPRKVLRIHPSFRILALANAPSAAALAAAARHCSVQPSTASAAPSSFAMPRTPSSFVHPEVLGMFDFHTFPALSIDETASVMNRSHPGVPLVLIHSLAAAAADLWSAASKEFSDDPATAQSLRVSMRQLMRAVQHLTGAPKSADATVFACEQLKEAVFYRSLTASGRSVVDTVLRQHSLLRHGALAAAAPALVLNAAELVSAIRKTRTSSGERPHDASLVPNTTFFTIPQHERNLQRMLADLASGSRHLLLLGTQGTGKNKLVDHLLQTLQWEREYTQLHRDSTVASITLSPTLRDGVIMWDDSALVRAARYGRVLVIDELDKAPSEVVAVLKALVDDGDMLLGDGRRLVSAPSESSEDPNVIPVHPKFMIWALANRPGW